MAIYHSASFLLRSQVIRRVQYLEIRMMGIYGIAGPTWLLEENKFSKKLYPGPGALGCINFSIESVDKVISDIADPSDHYHYENIRMLDMLMICNLK